MSQSNQSKHIKIEHNSSPNVIQKNVRELSTAEIEQLMKQGVKQAKERMHLKGISTVASIDGKIYEEHPNGMKTLHHG